MIISILRKVKIFFQWIRYYQEEGSVFKIKSKSSFEPKTRDNNLAIERNRVNQTDLEFAISNIGILKGHPLNQTNEPLVFWPNRCKCIFTGVQKSIIKFHPYMEYPPGSNQWIPDENQPPSVDERSFAVDEPVSEFALEGMYQDPIAWIDWEIHSVSFSLEIDPRDEKHILTGSEYSKLQSQSRKAEVW